MDFFDLGNITACCTCARKDDSLQETGRNDYYKRGDEKTGAAKVGRVEKPQLGGVGIVFQGTENGGLMVSSIMANGPAAASGLVQEGDLLISVNGVSIDGMTDRKFSHARPNAVHPRHVTSERKRSSARATAQLRLKQSRDLVQNGHGMLLYADRLPVRVCSTEQLARNLLGPLGSKVTLGLERPNGTKFDAELCRAFTSKQRASAVSDVNKGS